MIRLSYYELSENEDASWGGQREGTDEDVSHRGEVIFLNLILALAGHEYVAFLRNSQLARPISNFPTGCFAQELLFCGVGHDLVISP